MSRKSKTAYPSFSIEFRPNEHVIEFVHPERITSRQLSGEVLIPINNEWHRLKAEMRRKEQDDRRRAESNEGTAGQAEQVTGGVS